MIQTHTELQHMTNNINNNVLRTHFFKIMIGMELNHINSRCLVCCGERGVLM